MRWCQTGELGLNLVTCCSRLPSIFSYYSGLLSGNSEAAKRDSRQIGTTELLMFLLILFFSHSCGCVSMSQNSDLQIAAGGLGVLVLGFNRLVR